MDFNKIIYHCQLLEKHYVNSNHHDWLQGVEKDTNSEKEECCIKSIKYLYLYQRLKNGHKFPEWFKNFIQDKKRYYESYFCERILNMIKVAQFSEEVNTLLEKKVIGLYQKKVNIYSESIIDDLPLHLRLNVYLKLYQHETSEKMACYLRNHLAITLAKFGELQLAQKLSLYNWVIAQEFNNFHFVSSDYLKTVLNYHKLNEGHRTQWKVDKKASHLAQELCVYYEHLLKNAYTNANTATLDLVTMCYSQYPQLKEMLLPIKTYLRTKNELEFYEKINHLKKAFIYQYHELLLMEENNEQTCLIRDQFIIYKQLLKIHDM